MSQPLFSVGDFVYLKSGGPKMTVTSVSENSKKDGYIISTKWFAGQKISHTRDDQNAFTSEDPNPKKEDVEKK
ncbi:DUF2158 domain-containing protein [Acinetobacter seifertii]|uniref:DUF2158 domain-containing protein n=1 Tax=Acinetobacter seifertii TaxID=1530123 RepID=A0A7H2PW48_9GAMM|nr:DUF2158 domain-containing protein [Acinetobacter seifertii]QNX07067.1 DUF2158 domain-containing protein [Acinetobacter seifertii]QNX07081.1 DUF2158 domain-containing protein [Acinetobacter seifertii]